MYSRLDLNIEFDDQHATLTLTRIGEHAQIIVEMIEKEKYLSKVIHLTGVGSSRANPISSGNGYALGNSPCATSKAEIEAVDLTHKAPKYKTKSSTWVVPKHKALVVLAQEGVAPNFNIYGAFNFFECR